MLYTETNYLGTISLADSCIKYCEDLQAFIYASTSEVYGNQDNLPISENNNPRPNTPYAISKYASELYLKEYLFKAYEFPVIIARPFNTYGRALVNQPHYIVEKIIVEMLKDSKEITLGNPKIKRDFMFRDDHVNAYLSILNAVEKGKNIYGEAFNFCTGQNITIESLAIMLIDLIGWSGNIVWNTHIRPNDIDILWGDCSKAKNVLGWIANHSLKSGLVKAINEWKEVLELKYSYMPSYIIKSRWRRKSRS
jgi:nucleoside-diphosphate-sugar epimerase